MCSSDLCPEIAEGAVASLTLFHAATADNVLTLQPVAAIIQGQTIVADQGD